MKKKELLITIIMFMIISIVSIYYAKDLSSIYNHYFIKQLLFYIVSFFMIYIISKFNINFILDKALYLYIIGCLLLVLTLFIGSNINGSTSWIRIGPFGLQASEFMKIFIILLLRKYTINYKGSDIKYILITFFIILIPSILTFIEQDTGPIIIYFIIYITYLFIKKINKYYFIGGFILLLITSITFFILYFNYSDTFIKIFGNSFFYRMDRITNFINGKGYQLKQALISISSSGIFGSKNAVYFPEAPTDFIFTLIVSSLGIIGMIILLITYLFFINSLFSFKDKYLLYPIIFIILFQFSVNVLMNIGLFPIIGITLPFISYGGSSLLSFMILIGLLLNKKVSNDT